MQHVAQKSVTSHLQLCKVLVKAATGNSDEHHSRLMVVRSPSVEVEHHRVEGERHEKSREGWSNRFTIFAVLLRWNSLLKGIIYAQAAVDRPLLKLDVGKLNWGPNKHVFLIDTQYWSIYIAIMLPFDNRDIKQGQGKTSLMEGKFPDYMRRLCDFRQMDFEAAFDQLLTLISLEPQQM